MVPDRNHRIELHKDLVTALGSDQVFFQPPESVRMKYPAIVYRRADELVYRSDNGRHVTFSEYEVTLIDRSPDPEALDRLRDVSATSLQSTFTKDNLNHYVFRTYR